MVKSIPLLIFSLVLLWTLPQTALAAKVRAVADRDRLASGGSLQLELRVEGSPDDDPDLAPLQKDWEILGNSQSSQIRMVNGDFSRSLVYSLTLMPRREGNLTIPAVCFGSDCSDPLPIRVTAADESPGTAAADPFLEAEIAPREGISQGELLLSVRLFHRVDLLQGSLTEPAPTGVDAVVEKLGEDRRYETRRAGLLYEVVERRYAIFPQASGTLRIPPLRFDGEIGHGSSFDPFRSRGERVRRTSRPLEVEVLPPPGDLAGRPWLPARSLSLSGDWQGKVMKLTVGEPATRTLTVRAEGLQAAQLPELKCAIPEAFKSYPDQPSRKDEEGTAGVTGEMQQKVALIATRPGRYRLPAVDLDWWDVEAKSWRSAHLDPVEIEVSPAAGTAAAPPPPSPPPSQAAPASETPPRPPEPAAPNTSASSSPGAAGFWPWLSLGLGLGWLATLLLIWRQAAGKSRPVAEPSGETPRSREKAARQAVMRAARSNDPRASRQALSAWSATLWPESGRPEMERLRRTATELLRREIERLDRALYAKQEETWTGASLEEALRRYPLTGEDGRAPDGLPGLYPGPSN